MKNVGNLNKNFFFVILLLFAGFTVRAQSETGTVPVVKNIIFMIGDGMGVAQIYAGYTANKGSLNLGKFKDIGFSITNSASDYITESAAGATAFSIGEKTHNGAIGVDSNDRPRPTILEIAEGHKLSTGLVVTTDITDATPAAFVAHVPSRKMQKEIAEAYLKSNVNVFIGAGKQHFYSPENGTNLIDKLIKKGYHVLYNVEDIVKVKSGKIAGLLPEKKANERGDQLTQTAMEAIRILNQNSKGFFLMIEGSKIDDAGHANDLPWLTDEVIDFDNTIGKVLDFAKKNGHTLVVVTADHETDGLTLTRGDIKKGKVEGKFSTDDHTGVMVPVFAYGPGAQAFTGIYQNNSFFNKFMNAYGFYKK
ncbi:MAG: alkaline phosphatase [Ginsengibacter sp.]